eukprot:scaffold53708_cov61-Cyclotella_meneghiniana.AAC.8
MSITDELTSPVAQLRRMPFLLRQASHSVARSCERVQKPKEARSQPFDRTNSQLQPASRFPRLYGTVELSVCEQKEQQQNRRQSSGLIINIPSTFGPFVLLRYAQVRDPTHSSSYPENQLHNYHDQIQKITPKTQTRPPQVLSPFLPQPRRPRRRMRHPRCQAQDVPPPGVRQGCETGRVLLHARPGSEEVRCPRLFEGGRAGGQVLESWGQAKDLQVP